MEDSLGSRITNALRWTALARFSAQLLSWVVTIVVIRLLVPADYGLMAMAEVLYALLLSLTMAGLADGLIQARDQAEDAQLLRKKARSVLSILLLFNTALAVLQWISAPALALYFKEPDLVNVSRALAIGFFFLPWLAVANTLLKRELHFKPLALTELFTALATSLLTLGLAWQGAGVWALIIGQLVNLGLRAAILPWLAKSPVLPSLDLQSGAPLLRFGATVSATALVWYAYVRLDTIIGGHLLDTATLGVYAVAMHLAGLPMTKLMPLLQQVAYPGYAQVRDDPAQMRWYFRKSVRLVGLVVLPAFVGLAIVAQPLVHAVLGARWADASLPLALLALSMPWRMLAQLYSPGVRALGRPDIPLQNALATLLILAVALFFFAGDGPTGMAIAWLITAPLMWLITHFRCAPIFKVSLTDLLDDLLPAIAISTSMAGTVALFDHALVTLPVWPRLAALATVGVLVYLLMLRLFEPARFKEATNLVKRQ